MFAIVSAILIIALVADAGTVGSGGPCLVANNHLDPASHKFISDCTDQTFCSGAFNTTCAPRLCRRDEFPFGYNANDPLPPLCELGSFCPDEGSGCVPLAAEGMPCQLNRDEQCAPSPDWRKIATSQNFNGSICLRTTCMYANMTLGQSCITDSTTYIDIGPDGQKYANTITRDNCRSPQFYCDPIQMICRQTKPVGLGCSSDAECERYNNCGDEAICVDPPETPLGVAAWQWAAMVLCILGAMVTTCAMLTLVHKRHRYQRHKELREYYLEQLSLRRSIIALHTAAADGYVDEKIDR